MTPDPGCEDEGDRLWPNYVELALIVGVLLVLGAWLVGAVCG